MSGSGSKSKQSASAIENKRKQKESLERLKKQLAETEAEEAPLRQQFVDQHNRDAATQLAADNEEPAKNKTKKGGEKSNAGKKATNKTTPAKANGNKRNNKKKIDNKIAKPGLRRLARKGGIKRIGGGFYDVCRNFSKDLISKLVHDSAVYMESGRRKTLTSLDIIYAAKRMNMTLYGSASGLSKKPKTKAKQ